MIRFNHLPRNTPIGITGSSEEGGLSGVIGEETADNDLRQGFTFERAGASGAGAYCCSCFASINPPISRI